MDWDAEHGLGCAGTEGSSSPCESSLTGHRMEVLTSSISSALEEYSADTASMVSPERVSVSLRQIKVKLTLPANPG